MKVGACRNEFFDFDNVEDIVYVFMLNGLINLIGKILLIFLKGKREKREQICEEDL